MIQLSWKAVRRGYFAAVAAAAFAGGAQAAVVEGDWKTSGDGLVTRDMASGLEWLDLTQTLNLNVALARAQTGSGGALEGWRVATMEEAFDLYRSAVGPVVPASNGNTSVYPSTPAEAARMDTLVHLLGVTWSMTFKDVLRTDSIGWVDHSELFKDEPYQAAVYLVSWADGKNDLGWFNEGASAIGHTDPIMGVFMVRAAAAVPEPATWASMIAGLAVAGAALRRRTTKVAFAA